MHIYADVRCLQDENYSFRGVGYHSSTLLKSCKEFFPQATLVGLIDESLPNMPECYRSLFDVTQNWTQATFPHSNSIFLEMSPMTHDLAACGRFLDKKNILSCAVVYDFIPLDQPHRYLSHSESLRSYAASMLWLGAFDLFSPISEYSERRLLEQLEVSPEQSFVSGVTLRKAFEDILATKSEPSPNARKRPVRGDYFLFVGGADPRKNVDVLLHAHATLERELKSEVVIVGKYPEDFKNAIRNLYETVGGNLSKLHFKHNVPDAELADWYHESTATICSSHIEGFSLPVIEAIACGAPVLASDIDAHRELIVDDNSRFTSTDHEQLKILMTAVACEYGFRNKLLAEQQHVPHKFVATKVARRFWQPLQQAYNQYLDEVTSPVGYQDFSRRAELAILSPFPPDRSGVADYTRRTVEAIAPYVDVDVYTDAESPLPTQGVRNFFEISEWAYLSGKYDRVLSVIGNSHFHTKIIDLQRAHGGPCLIHDNRLAELYCWWKGPEYFRRMACQTVGREVSQEEAISWIHDPGKLPGIFFDELLESSNPLIVHSRGIQKQILKQYNVHAEYLPFCCYRGFDEHELVTDSRQKARRKLSLPDDTLHIISLGIVASCKAPDRCIEAIAMLRDSNVKAHFHFVGSSDEATRAALLGQAKALGVDTQIHFCGDWISDEDYRNYILAADYAVQLRTHFFGGLSGAMLDCIASGVPTVANLDLAEALDSPDSVLRISDQMQSREVADALLMGYRNNMHHVRLRACRTEYLQQHSFENYAQEMLKLFELVSTNAMPTSQLRHAC